MDTQTNELVLFENYKIINSRLIIPIGLPFHEWVDLGKKLHAADEKLQFAIGDWINYGAEEYEDRRYLIGMAETGFKYQTIKNIAAVSKKFNGTVNSTIGGLATRHNNIGFWLHAEVATLPGPVAERFLNKVEEEHLKEKDLRAEVQKWKSEHNQQKPTHIPEYVFSWAKDEENLAGFDGLEDANTAFNKLASDKRDRDTARYFAETLIAKAKNYIKEWERGMEVWR